MKTSVFHEYKLSQLMLGTVQFGMNYGIANKSGRPSYQTVLKIMECAAAHGVNCLDTASAYGDSEEVLGQVLQELGMADKIVVVTKVPAMNDNLSPKQADSFIEEALKASLKRLQLEVLPICLFHQERNTVYAESLIRMKKKGMIKHIGISVNSPAAALDAIRFGHFEALQIPTNLLDHRYYASGVFHEAKHKGIALFIRSVYLQGLLFLAENEIPPELADIIGVRRHLNEIAGGAGMSLGELAVRFILSLEGIHCLIVGLETIEQLQANLKMFAQGPLPADLLATVLDAVPQLPDRILVPSLWSKRVMTGS